MSRQMDDESRRFMEAKTAELRAQSRAAAKVFAIGALALAALTVVYWLLGVF